MRPPSAIPATDLTLASRLGIALATFLACWSVYGIVAHEVVTTRPPFTLAIDGAIPFVPQTVWFYMPGYAGAFLLTLFTMPTRRHLQALAVAFLAMFAGASVIFHLWPVLGPRPVFVPGPTWSDAFLAWVYRVDPNVNTLPSLHVANSALCVWVVTPLRRAVGVACAILTFGVCVSVLTLKQHWFVDIPAGLAWSVFGLSVYQAALRVPSWRTLVQLRR